MSAYLMRPSVGLQHVRQRVLVIAITLAIGVQGIAAQPAPAATSGALRLSRLFGDGIVLQRRKPIAVWGWAPAGAQITIAFRGRTTRATSSRNGSWMAKLPASEAGGPFELTVRAGDAHVDLHNVLVGDVWIASGQSNMEFTVSQGNNTAQEIAAANDSLIRQFKVPDSWSNDPQNDLVGGSWTPADRQHVGDFSAVAYFFARELRKSTKVPIGIVNTTWGGSNIETWIGRGAQHISDSAWTALLHAEEARLEQTRAALRAKLGGLPTKDPGLMNGVAVWADPSLDDSGWSDMPVPSYWEDHGYTGMDGVAWYRVAFDATDAEQRDGATLSIAAIDDDDIAWINGVEVGRTVGYNVARAYRIPSNALRVGRNVLAVRVSDGGGGGGINGAVSIAFGSGAPRSLAGVWKFKVGEVSFQLDGQQINKVPSVLYNRMLHPILPSTIMGVIWYQGESNANNLQQAAAYRDQFRTLITSWRREWDSGRDTFPFLWVQLPNFGTPDTVPPTAAAWATQRESMTAALSLPKTGQAIAIDVGDADNIHPRNKQDVGLRLALVARKVAYGEHIVASGPAYRSHSIRGDTIAVTFDTIGSGLASHLTNGRVGGFEIAGADRHFVWAEAEIVGNTVRVWSDRVNNPIAVRYAWANNPDRASLFNREGLPAAPFRTDRW
jgi:sialate O-acetylesterase